MTSKIDPIPTTMEDRKRSILNDGDDAGPPTKKQATGVNGPSSRLDTDKEKEIENYQKDAILRQMREYKREKTALESQVSDLNRRATFHDDHVKLIDAWFAQLIDEISVMVVGIVPTTPQLDTLHSSLLTENAIVFGDHLTSRSTRIKQLIQEIYSRVPGVAPEVRELQEKIVALLATEKAHTVELQRVSAEKDQLTERLENASYRYLMAERKLDRAKSVVVQKLEQQAVLKSTDDSSSSTIEKQTKTEKVETNGDVHAPNTTMLDSARREALAAVEKHKLHVEQLETENKRLRQETTEIKLKRVAMNDEDYSKTTLFTVAKTQLDDMIKKVNDLKAINNILKDEVQKMQADRTAYKIQVDDESRTVINENESSLARTETDLSRIRNARDELTAEMSILKSSRVNSGSQSVEALRELTSAQELRILTLESELERERLKSESTPGSSDGVEDLSLAELASKYRSLETQYKLVSNEMVSMESAYRKVNTVANKKIADISSSEEQLSRLSAEKAKADQKYFAAMKSKEARENELRLLKMQNSKTSEIVSQLKDTEQATRALAVGLEKQVGEAKEGITRLESLNRAMQLKVSESELAVQIAKTEILELKKMVTTKDDTASKAGNEKRKIEVELSEVQTKLEDSVKNVEQLKKRSLKSGDSAETDDWRRIAICPVCNANLRNTAMRLCGHVFCNDCVQDLISRRSRKCPACSRAFGTNDTMPIVLA